MMQIGLMLREIKEMQIETQSRLDESLKESQIENQRKMEELQNNISEMQGSIKENHRKMEEMENAVNTKHVLKTSNVLLSKISACDNSYR